eukprot:8278049-Lingulodinium_polyedra.AAC.1
MDTTCTRHTRHTRMAQQIVTTLPHEVDDDVPGEVVEVTCGPAGRPMGAALWPSPQCSMASPCCGGGCCC